MRSARVARRRMPGSSSVANQRFATLVGREAAGGSGRSPEEDRLVSRGAAKQRVRGERRDFLTGATRLLLGALLRCCPCASPLALPAFSSRSASAPASCRAAARATRHPTQAL